MSQVRAQDVPAPEAPAPDAPVDEDVVPEEAEDEVGPDASLDQHIGACAGCRPIRPHPGHAALWEASLLTTGTVAYFIEKRRGSVQWTAESWPARFSREAYRYDNNSFPQNFVLHPLSGAIFYGVARANDLSIAASAGYSLATSFAWEFLLEFHDKVSVNDLVATASTGIVLGEFLHQLGRYVNSAPGGGTRRHRILGRTFGPAVAFHDWVHHRPRTDASRPRDALGFSAEYWHRFRASTGVTITNANPGPRFVGAELRLEGEIVHLPRYLQPGDARGWFARGNFTSFRLRCLASAEGRSCELESDLVLAGFRRQRIAPSARGASGFASMIGVDMGYTYRRQKLDAFPDGWGSVHMPGVVIDQTFLSGPVTLRIAARINPDFDGVYSLGYRAWQDANPGAVGKDVLATFGYYYGWGFATRARVDLWSPHFEAALSVDYRHTSSDENLSRNQEDITVDQRVQDRAFDVEGAVRVIPARGVFVEANVLRRRRRSAIEDVHTDRSLVQTVVSVGVVR